MNTATEPRWFFGLLREGGVYRIVASGPTEGSVRRALVEYTLPTAVATLDELAPLGISEREWRHWLPETQRR